MYKKGIGISNGGSTIKTKRQSDISKGLPAKVMPLNENPEFLIHVHATLRSREEHLKKKHIKVRNELGVWE